MSNTQVRILLVNNQTNGVGSLRSVLRQEKRLQVVTASDALDCLRRIREAHGNFDVVLFDMDSGREAANLKAAKRIEAHYPHIKTIIANSGQPENGHGLKKRVASSSISNFLLTDGLAAYVEAAVERRKLQAELQQSEQERDWFRGLLGISQSITSSRDPHGVAQAIYKQLRLLIPGMDSFYIAVHDYKHDELRLILLADRGKIIRRFKERLSNEEEWGWAGSIIKNRKPIFIEDIRASENRSRLRHFNNGKSSRTYFGLPLISGEKLIGVISTQSHSPCAFSKDHQRLIQAIANQTAVAMENALLHEQESAERARVPSKLYKTISAVRTASNLQDVLNLIVANLQELFDLDTCTIGLIDSNKTKIEVVAECGIGQKVTRHLKDLPRDLVQKVLTSSELIEIPIVGRRPVLREALVRQDLKAMVILPLRGKEDLHGVITMGSSKPISLPLDERSLLKALADQAAIAIENAHLHERTRTWARQLESLSRMTLDIANQSQHEDLLRAIISMAAGLLQSPGGAVYLYSGKGEALVLEAIKGLSSNLERRQIEPGKGLIGRVLQSGKTLAVSDYRHWPHRLKILDKYNLMATVAAPIICGGERFGAIVVHDDKEGRVYTPADEKLLSHFAGHAGVAIQKARKAQKERAELIEEEKVISKVTDALTAELDYRKLLNRVTEVLRERLGYQHSALFLNDALADGLNITIEPSDPENSPRISRIERGHRKEGIIKHVADTGKALIVPDVKKETLYQPGLGCGSEIAVPLKIPTSSGTKIIGVLDVENPQVNAFGERDKRILTKVAAALAIAIETAHKTMRLQALANLGANIAGSKDLDDILNMVAREMLKACPASFCHIMLRTRDEQNILRVRAWHAAPRAEGLDWKPQKGQLCLLLTNMGLAKRVSRAGSVVFRRKKSLGYRFVNGFARHTMLKGKLDSAILIPLRGAGGKIIGTCVLGEMRKWTRASFQENIKFATALAAQAAIAVEKERGQELAFERTKTMDRLHQVGNAIAATLELDKVLQQIVEAARELLQAEVCSIFLIRRQNYLSLETSSGSSPKVSNKPIELLVTKDQGLTGHIAKLGRLFSKHGKELTDHPAVIKKGPQSHLPSRYCHSMLAIPLKRRKSKRPELLGLIKVENKLDQTGKVAPQRGFDKTDFVVLKTLASYAETALENVRLYDLARSSQTVAEVVNSTLDFEQVLKLVLTQLKGRIPFETTSLQLLRGGELKIVACEGFGKADKKKVMRLSFPVTDKKFPNYEVIKSKRPYLVSDIRATDYRHFWDEVDVYCSGNIRSWMGIPLLSGNEPIGMLSIESKVPFCYTDKHRELGVAFSRQVAPAVFNAKLYKTTQTLLNIILQITEQLDLKGVLRKLARAVVDKDGIIEADSAIIYVYDPDHDQVEQSPVCAGLSASAQSSLNSEPSLRSAVHRLLRLKRPRIRTDVRTDPLLYRDFARQNKVESVGVFPLHVANRSVGVMFVNYLSRHIFDRTEIELTTLIARKAALAIGHARKYEVARERFEIAKKAAMSLYAMSAWAHDAHKLSYKIDGNVKLLESSLNQHRRDSRVYMERIKQSLKSLFDLPTPPADLDQMQQVNLSRAYEAIRERHAAEIRRKHINIEMNLDALPDVLTNEWLLSEVFHHLTQNAVEALDNGGTIILSGYVKESTVYVRFSDKGRGIPQKVLKVLFKRRVPSHKREGSGVGLLLSKMYLNACDGDLTLKHSDQKGTSFVLNLPAVS